MQYYREQWSMLNKYIKKKGRTAHRRSSGIALPFHDQRHQKGVRGQRHAPAAFYLGKEPVPILQEAGWAPGPVWTNAKKLAPTGIRFPDRPGRSQQLRGIRYKINRTLSFPILIYAFHAPTKTLYKYFGRNMKSIIQGRKTQHPINFVSNLTFYVRNIFSKIYKITILSNRI